MPELINSGEVRETKIIKILPGEDIQESLQSFINHQQIENAVILTGIGSAARWRFHVVSSAELPPEEAFPEGQGAVDITAITGYVLNGRLHAHITFSNDKIAFGGHLEPGCKTLTFVIITLGILDSSLQLEHLDRLNS